MEAGTKVSVGYYDREEATWTPSDNRIVLKVVGNGGGLALVDATGDDQAEDDAALGALGINSDERQTLAQIDQPGESFWRANRPGVPDLFERELERGSQRVLDQPDLAQLYQNFSERIVRRLLLPKTEQHVYYFVDSSADTLIVITIWGARRGRAPKL